MDGEGRRRHWARRVHVPRSASFNINAPRSVGTISRQVLKASRAAATATSTSSAPAAKTDAISDSSLGFMLVIFSPDFDLTNSLLMKRPVGWVYLWPLGAVSSMERLSDDIFVWLSVRLE